MPHSVPDATLPPIEAAGRATDFLQGLSPERLAVPESGIVEIFNYGRDRQGLIPLWVGEGDLPTPAFIGETAARSFAAGETFYTYQRGIPDLRAAIADYMTRTYGTPFADAALPFGPERFFVTIGGMHALQVALTMVAGSGSEVLVPTPAWPNFRGVITAAGAQAIDVPMSFAGSGAAGRWTLDIERLATSVTPRTRAIVVNSPSNPTGWMATMEDLAALLALSRQHGLWLIADEIYGRLVYDRPRAPSFHDLMDEQDRVMFVQTLSKNWAMTGWRIGWLEAPPALGPMIENLVQYSTSGAPVPLQRGAVAALNEGDEVIGTQIERARRSRDILGAALAASGRIDFAMPNGAFYLFGKVHGIADSRDLAFRLVDEAGIGVAPGSAFGEAGQGFMRICFARDPDSMPEVARRLQAWIG